jgi:hypothetical protein
LAWKGDLKMDEEILKQNPEGLNNTAEPEDESWMTARLRGQTKVETGHFGQYGNIRRDYLKYYDKKAYRKMMKNEPQFAEYLVNIEKSCRERHRKLVEQMAAADPIITEKLKSTNQMMWVGLMNNIDSRAQEIIIHEISQ